MRTVSGAMKFTYASASPKPKTSFCGSSILRPKMTGTTSATVCEAASQGLRIAAPPAAGSIGLIKRKAAEVSPFMRKGVSVCYELMFTRSLFRAGDIEVAPAPVGKSPTSSIPADVRSTMRENYGRIDAANLTRAVAFLKPGRAIGKVVLAGF
jgi:hypothetical protein